LIEIEQLTAALDRLSARDREVLDFSLRRRVPDEALAKLYGWDAAAVARCRVHAIERLADDLGAQRGEDLGQILKGLLEAATWATAEPHDLVPEAPAAVPAPVEEPPPAIPTRPSAPPAPERGRSSAHLIAGAILAAAILVAAGVVWAAGLAEDRGVAGGGGSGGSQSRFFVPARSGPLANPFPSDPDSAVGSYATAYVPASTSLYDAPAGRRTLRLARRTEWGSPRVLGVLRERGGWLAVQAPELPNGGVGWIPPAGARIDAVNWALRADLSRRRLRVERDGKTVRSMRMAVGRKDSPTPLGRFTITDKLRVTDKGSPYGCCVLALSGHQEHLPKDWPGGDRLAVHATTDTSSLGHAVSLGCMRVNSAEARWLIRSIPLGTPIFVQR
jgi:L,D-transpeptidase catalytic domain